MNSASPGTFPASFLLLQQEGYLVSSCLGAGLTELRRAHVGNKGAFYTALFNLSTGLERLLKVIVIIDHMLENSLAVPSKRQLKAYGHDIVGLYGTSEVIAAKRLRQMPPRQQLAAIDQDILRLLSDFARTTRYHNLDGLSASQGGPDPLVQWNQIIVAILGADVPTRKRARVLGRASALADAISGVTHTLMHGLDGRQLTTAEALALPGLHEQTAPFAVLRIVRFLSPMRNLLEAECCEAYGIGASKPPFPQMHEFPGWLSDDPAYVLGKKRWP